MHLEITGAIALREASRVRAQMMAEARIETLLAPSRSGARVSWRRGAWVARLSQLTNRLILNPAPTVKDLTPAPSIP